MFNNKKKLTVSKSGIRLSRKPKRESFLPDDKEWINKNIQHNPQIELGDPIAAGMNGEVYHLKGNNSLVIKVPKNYRETDRDKQWKGHNSRRSMIIESKEAIEREYDHTPLFSPSVSVILPGKSPSGGNYIGIIRPKVEPVFDFAKEVSDATLKKLTRAQIEEIRLNLITISYDGYTITDGLQIGFDKIGRPLMYDLGGIEHTINPSEREIRFILLDNEIQWIKFLRRIGKTGTQEQLKGKYGVIE